MKITDLVREQRNVTDPLRLQRGFGDTFDPNDPVLGKASWPGPIVDTGSTLPQTSSNAGGWFALGAGLEKLVSNIFAPPAVSVAQAGVGVQQYQQPYRYPTGVLPTTGVGLGIDGNGIRLSDGSHISWSVLAIAGLGIFLLQSRGFSRR